MTRADINRIKEGVLLERRQANGAFAPAQAVVSITYRGVSNGRAYVGGYLPLGENSMINFFAREDDDRLSATDVRFPIN